MAPFWVKNTLNSSSPAFARFASPSASSTKKITDIYATAIDDDARAQATQRFFATVQNKLHWAIHGQTAAEVIRAGANAEHTHMGLNTWQDAPNGKIQKFDVVVAKNSCNDTELAQLQRLVSAYPGFGRIHGRAQYPHDHARLGSTPEPIY